MTDKEAMKMALEALELLTGAWQTVDALDYGDNAITALKEQLAEHAMSEVQRLGQEIEQEPVRLQCVTCGTVYADGVPPQVTQPEQEPVAWMNPDEQNARKAFHWVKSEEFSSAVYTTPPQRTWVGLTEQEHTDIAVECGCMSADWVFYGAAVERKLKERNT